jgi:tripartite-type tricarboxylate transporter receptor subunit TctC
VPCKGSSEAVLETLAKHIQLISDPLVMPYMQSGKLRALALLDAERHPDFPDVPTLKEASKGLPFENVNVPSLQSFLVAVGSMDEIARKLNKTMIAIAGAKDLRERLFQNGFGTRQDTVEQLAAELSKENQFFADLIKQVGLKQE